MTLARILNIHRVLRYQDQIIEQQQALIHDLNERLQRSDLDHAREMEGIVAGWLISLERPEVDLRGELAVLLEKHSHRIAKLEEHIL